jgi:hypothetical protein
MERKEPSLAEQLSRIQEDVKSLAKTLKIDPETALKLLSHRELVIMNAQLRAVHEMLDLLYTGKKVKKRGGKRG